MDKSELSLESMIRELEHISHIQCLDPDVPLVDLSVDSEQFLEWVYAIEEATGVPMDQQYGDIDELDRLTMRRLHSHVVAQMSATRQ
jgi:hypothetical protein